MGTRYIGASINMLTEQGKMENAHCTDSAGERGTNGFVTVKVVETLWQVNRVSGPTAGCSGSATNPNYPASTNSALAHACTSLSLK